MSKQCIICKNDIPASVMRSIIGKKGKILHIHDGECFEKWMHRYGG